MKKTKILAAIAAATLWSSCGGGSTNGLMKSETLTVEKTVSITNETGAPKCSVNLQLETVKGGTAERMAAINETIARQLLGIEGAGLKEAADSFANKYTSDYVKNFAPLYREDCSDETKRAWYEYHYNIMGEASEGREGVLVYTATIDYYEGGAHGINQRIVMNFDNETGRLLTLADVFAPGYEQPLNELLQDALIKKVGAKDVKELREKGYLYSMDMFAPENFVLGEDEVTFIYNPYEIAPYAMGLIELVIDNDDLEDLWK